MAYLLDTSILGRLILPSDPEHHIADATVAALLARGEELYVSPQNPIELRSVATRPAGTPANGMGLTSAQADAEIERIVALFGFLPDTAAIFPKWQTLVSDHLVMGRNVHDARLAAVMLVYGITHILTLNGTHFKRFPGISVTDPAAVISDPISAMGRWKGHAINELGQPSELDSINLEVFADLTFSGSRDRLLHGSMNSFKLCGRIAEDGSVTFRSGYRDEKTGSPTSLEEGFGTMNLNELGELIGVLNLGTPQLIVMALTFVLERDLG